MLLLVEKLKILVAEFERNNKALELKDQEAAIQKKELDEKLSKVAALEKDLNERNAKITVVEDLMKAKVELDRRETVIAQREQDLKKKVEKSDADFQSRENALKQRADGLDSLQKDLTAQKEKLVEDRKNFKKKVIEEIGKTA